MNEAPVMSGLHGSPSRLIWALLIAAPLCAVDAERDFSGKWIFDSRASNAIELPLPPHPVLNVTQKDRTLDCDAGASRWTYYLDGKESKYKLGDSTMNSVVKWEGAALLVNTLVSGPRNYTAMDRWRLSRDHAELQITRQIVNARGQTESVLLYRREGTTPAMPRAQETSATEAAQPLSKRPETTAQQTGIVVPTGTRIPLRLLNTIDSKHSREGDRIYLETSVPVAQDGRVVIPKGSSVAGTLTKAKPAGRPGKGELYLRFDSLTLPNGVTRDFRSRLSGADGDVKGQVDRKEGKVSGEKDHGGEARRVGETTTAGAAVGGIATRTGTGVGVGAAAGAAAGLASVLFSKGPDAVLQRGTMLEMTLDRDLVYQEVDLIR
jgi:hypothetical protein